MYHDPNETYGHCSVVGTGTGVAVLDGCNKNTACFNADPITGVPPLYQPTVDSSDWSCRCTNNLTNDSGCGSTPNVACAPSAAAMPCFRF